MPLQRRRNLSAVSLYPKFFLILKQMDDFNPSPYKDMEQQIKQRRAAVNDAFTFNDLTEKEYKFEIAAVEIAVCNFILDNPKWNTRLQKLEYILDMLVDMSDRNICIFLPEDEQAQQDYLIKEIFECLKEINYKIIHES